MFKCQWLKPKKEKIVNEKHNLDELADYAARSLSEVSHELISTCGTKRALLLQRNKLVTLPHSISRLTCLQVKTLLLLNDNILLPFFVLTIAVFLSV